MQIDYGVDEEGVHCISKGEESQRSGIPDTAFLYKLQMPKDGLLRWQDAQEVGQAGGGTQRAVRAGHC